MRAADVGGDVRTFTDFHLFCGSGGLALGYRRQHARVGATRARFECLGGVDADPLACRDFTRLVGTPATCMDLFTEVQYRAFHGEAPPPGWREVTGADLRAAARGRFPDVVSTSSPCKGLSGLLPERTAASPRYQALNGLTLRGIQLVLDAFGDDPPSLVVFENVPRIESRGRALLDEIQHELELAGYKVALTKHDCGEIGGLAQRRRRFLLVARHRAKVPNFLYEPPKRRVRAVGEVLGPLPLPDDPAGGPMHRIARLQWQTWYRLALIPAGADWRALERMDPGNFRVVPSWQATVLGVGRWDAPAPTIKSRSGPTNGAYSVGDPRVEGARRADWFGNVFRVAPVEGGDDRAHLPSGALPSLGKHHAKMRVEAWDGPAHTITGSDRVGSGAPSVADPRPTRAYVTSGKYGIVGWDQPARTVPGAGQHDNGYGSVADPREPDLVEVPWRWPSPKDRPDPVPVILSLDGTWHRPFTTLELAVIQGFEPDWLVAEPLAGRADADWRERIGNAVPPPAAEAIATTMGTTLLLAAMGQTFALSETPIWAVPLATALSLDPFETIRP